MTKILETWKKVKEKLLKTLSELKTKNIDAQEEIKLVLHELVLTLSSDNSPNHSDYFVSALEKYKSEMPKEVKEFFEHNVNRNNRFLPLQLKDWYYTPIVLYIKDKVKELGVSWE